MYLYFNALGKLVEIINDDSIRKGADNVNKIYVHFENASYNEDMYLLIERANGSLTSEYLVETTITKQLPYDAKRDMRYFKDYTPYKFFVYTLQNTDLSVEGLTKATIRLVDGSTILALGLLTFNVENSVVNVDNGILQSQYDYILQIIQNKLVDQDNTITVLASVPVNLEDYEGRYILVPDGDFPKLYLVDGGVAVLQFHLSKTWADDITARLGVAESDIDKIEDGTTIVGKALADSLGNVVKDSYVSAVYPTYNTTTDKLFIETYSVEDGLMANNEVILPKATTTKNGLMSATDKVKVDNIASDIASMGATKQSLSEKNQINGYAGLDGNAKIPTVLLPDSILGQLEYKGTFDPASGYPATPEKGWFYISIANATISGVDYKVGDWAVYNGSSWDKVDNTDAVASVNGKIGVVVINGTEIQVGNGDTWTIEQRIVNIYAELNNRYTKAQTYSNTEIEQRLTDLLGLANLQDTAIQKSAGVFVFDNGDSLLATSLAQYNWVICRFYNVDGTVQNVRYNMFKPSEATSGNRTIVQIDRTPVRYAEIKRDNGNILFRVVDESDTFDNTYVCTMKMWGIKLDGITATEISYDGTISGLSSTNVKTAIDELASEKADKIIFNNYAKNGNMSSTTDYGVFGGTLSANANILTLTGGNTTSSPSVNQNTNAVLSNGIKLYVAIKVKHTNKQPTAFEMSAYGSSPIVLIKTMTISNPTLNSEYFMSMIAEPTTQTTNLRILLNPKYIDITTAENSTTEFREFIVINLTATFGSGNEPTKEQMDAIIKLKGYFDTTTINLKDLMLLGFTQETRMTPTLTNATTTYLTYRKDDLGYVDIVGNLTITTFGTNFTFPEGYRPLTQLRLPILTSTNTLGYIIINTNGTVVSNANATIYINSRFATI